MKTYRITDTTYFDQYIETIVADSWEEAQEIYIEQREFLDIIHGILTIEEVQS